MLRGWRWAIFAVLAGIAAVAIWLNWGQVPVSGEVVDAVTGRVPSGAVLTTDGFILRRFKNPTFDFGAGSTRDGLLRVEAPGYASLEIVLANAPRVLALKLEPHGIPDLGGTELRQAAEDRLKGLPMRDVAPPLASLDAVKLFVTDPSKACRVELPEGSYEIDCLRTAERLPGAGGIWFPWPRRVLPPSPWISYRKSAGPGFLLRTPPPA